MKKPVVEAVSYWITATGYELNDYVNPPLKMDKYARWLHTEIKKIVHPHKISNKELLENKDLFMDSSTKEGDGSFYTPKIWAEECYKVLKTEVPNIEDYNVWDASCGTGNLIDPFVDCKQLFASTLHEEDVSTVKERLPHSFAFQCDFLSGIDHNEMFKEFTFSLPKELQRVFENDEPIIFHMNPPYATKDAFKTDLGKHLKNTGETDIGADLLRQFVWRVYDIIEKNKLTKAYISLVGTQSMYILPKWESIVKLQQEKSNYKQGFVFPASEFPGINDSIKWGIFYTLWKYDNSPKGERILKPMQKIHMDFKENKDNKIIKTGDINLDYNRPYIKEFIKPNDLSDMKLVVPVANYKGDVSINVKGKPKLWGASENIMGYSLDKGSFKDITNFLGVAILPPTLNVNIITQGNFDKVVSQFFYNSFYSSDFLTIVSSYKAPLNYGDEKYKVFYANALLHLPFGRKSLQASYRDLEFTGIKRNFVNSMCPLSAKQVKETTKDFLLLEDMERVGTSHNEFYLNLVEEYKHLAWDSIRELYDFGMEFMLYCLNNRQDHNNSMLQENMLKAWDCGFRTLRFTSLATKEWEEEYSKKIKKVRDEVREKVNEYYVLLER